MSLYLWLDLLAISIPFAFSFHPKILFYREWKKFIPAIIIVGIIFVIWDIHFTKSGIWAFNERYTSGISWYGIPPEEYLFFICIPYACSFTFFTLKKLFPDLLLKTKLVQFILLISSMILFVTGIIYSEKLYTSSAFISAALVLILIILFFKKILPHLALTYLVILIPFLLINGTLTGSFIEEPVVSYNPAHNLGIRVFTIPLEDFFYGMTLIFGNIMLAESFHRIKRNFIQI